MKILWITNIPLPPVGEKMKMNRLFHGGWMYASLCAMKAVCPDLRFAVATLDRREGLFHEKIGEVDYYLLPERSRQCYDVNLESLWRQIRDEFRPDVIHIHGTEQPHGLAYLKACGSDAVVSSIQGLTSVYSMHYLNGVSRKDLIRSFSVYDLLRLRLLSFRKLAFVLRGRLEEEHIRRLKNIIGRTSWDRAHVERLNPSIRYHHVEETLRPEFYSGVWTYEKCVPQTIFLSQAGYPVKGLHFLIRALPEVIREFPRTQVFIGGGDILKREHGFLGGYGKLCLKLMRERGIEGRFHFLGALNAEEMKAQYLKANVFVSPSTIENSPNSVCEAQILGTPLVASDVGGVLDLVEHKKTGFVYRADDTSLLAFWIRHVFRSGENAEMMIPEMQEVAKKRHDGAKNAEALLAVYREIIGEASPEK